MGDFFINVLQKIIDGLVDTASFILDLLPSSPFNTFNSIAIDNNYLGYIAWIVPFKQIIALLIAWVACIAFYYIVSIILRWIKIIS